MLTVDDYGAIRRARGDGKSIRQIAIEFKHSRNTIRKILKQSEPKLVPSTRNRPAPILGPFQPIIDQILLDDETAPPKQRHTASSFVSSPSQRTWLPRRLCPGATLPAQAPTPASRNLHPPVHLPGHRLEADFGHIHVEFPDGRRLVPFLVTTWAYSNAPFVMAFPFERTEAILEGMVAAFEFFGGVPKQVWWDNPRTVATLILQRRQRQLQPRYAVLASHYLFDPRFCMPARGNEKPDAEGTVKGVQRRFATPVPRVADLSELNMFLRKCCEAERDRVVQSLPGLFTIKDRLAEDLAAATRLPNHRFDSCVIRPAAPVDKYQTVAFDNNRYSVSRRFAFQMVTVKGYVNRVEIVAQGQSIATHTRCLEKNKMILDPIHYTATLERKPVVLDHSPVFRDWKNFPRVSPTLGPSWNSSMGQCQARGVSHRS